MTFEEYLIEQNQRAKNDLDTVKTENYTKGYAEGYPNGEKDGFANGYEYGKTDGYNSGVVVGKEQGIEIGVEQGRQSEHNDFWEEIHSHMYSGEYAFGGLQWTDKIFKPIRDIVPTYGERFFARNGISDLKGCLERQNVKIDTSKSVTLYYAFYFCQFMTYAPTIDCSGVTSANGVNGLFNTCRLLKEIEKIILPDPSKISNYNSMLSSCVALERVIFEGVIGKSGFNLSGSPLLDHDSLMSVINCLAPTSTTMTVTLGTTNLAKLTDDEKAIATEKGWSLV